MLAAIDPTNAVTAAAARKPASSAAARAPRNDAASDEAARSVPVRLRPSLLPDDRAPAVKARTRAAAIRRCLS